MAGMAWLTPTLTATAFAPLQRLKPRTIAGGWFGGITRAAADPLPQARQLCGQGADLGSQLLELLLLNLQLLLLSQDQRFDGGWGRQPIRF